MGDSFGTGVMFGVVMLTVLLGMLAFSRWDFFAGPRSAYERGACEAVGGVVVKGYGCVEPPVPMEVE